MVQRRKDPPLGEITVKQITLRSAEQIKWDIYLDCPDGKLFKRYLRGQLVLRKTKGKWAVTFVDYLRKHASDLYISSERTSALEFADKLVTMIHQHIIPTWRVEITKDSMSLFFPAENTPSGRA